MSRRNIFGLPATLSGSAKERAGLGVAKVASASHRPCQRNSISAANSAVYRCGGTSGSARLSAMSVIASPSVFRAPPRPPTAVSAT